MHAHTLTHHPIIKPSPIPPTSKSQPPHPNPPHPQQGGPKVSLYLTLVGILAGFLSTFWNFSYLRTATKMQEFLDGADVAKVKKQAVRRSG